MNAPVGLVKMAIVLSAVVKTALAKIANVKNNTMYDKLSETIEEVYYKRPWLKEKIESNHELNEAINILKSKSNYSNIMNKFDLNDLQEWAIDKIIKHHRENRLHFLQLDTGD